MATLEPIWIPDKDEALQLRMDVTAHCGPAGLRDSAATTKATSQILFWTTLSASFKFSVSPCIHLFSRTGGSICPEFVWSDLVRRRIQRFGAVRLHQHISHSNGGKLYSHDQKQSKCQRVISPDELNLRWCCSQRTDLLKRRFRASTTTYVWWSNSIQKLKYLPHFHRYAIFSPFYPAVLSMV